MSSLVLALTLAVRWQRTGVLANFWEAAGAEPNRLYELAGCRAGIGEQVGRPRHLCWLALLLIRIAATTTRSTWPSTRLDLQKITLDTFTGPAGTFRQRTELTKTQRDILAQLRIDPPPRIFQLTTETP